MITVRFGDKRGHSSVDWLDSRHTFSFGDYCDPPPLGFRTLRVINDDRVAPGGGKSVRTRTATWRSSPTCSRGQLEHRDSMGNGEMGHPRRRSGRRMHAGTGIQPQRVQPVRRRPGSPAPDLDHPRRDRFAAGL